MLLCGSPSVFKSSVVFAAAVVPQSPANHYLRVCAIHSIVLSVEKLFIGVSQACRGVNRPIREIIKMRVYLAKVTETVSISQSRKPEGEQLHQIFLN